MIQIAAGRMLVVSTVLVLSVAACDRGLREGTYDQVLTSGSAMERAGYKATLVIEPNDRFRYQMPMASVAGDIRRDGDSLYFETGSADMRIIALRGRMVRDTLVLEQRQLAMLRGVVGQDVATQRFVRRER